MTMRRLSARGMAGLDVMLNPRSVAIVGASNDPGRVGGQPLHYLLRFGYEGRIYPVNPGRSSVQGLRSYASICEINEAVDLAVVVVAASEVCEIVEKCATAGVRAAVVFSAGFAEMGPEGQRRQARLRAIADQTGIRICGPNCAGVMNVRSRMTATFGSYLSSAPSLIPGSIALVSQSGAMAGYVLGIAQEQGIGFSHWVSTGNEADAQVSDFLELVASDPHARTIALYLEQIRDPEAFITACDLARTNGKSIVAVLAGRSDAAKDVLKSHTAAIAGDRDIAARALQECGVAVVESIGELLTTSIGLDARPRPSGRGLGLLTISGAAGIMMVDRAQELGFTVPKVPTDVEARMKALLPYAGTSNPVDVTGSISSSPEVFEPFLEELLAVPEIDIVVCFLGMVPLFPHMGERLCNELIKVSAASPKAVWLVGRVEPAHASRLASAGIPLFSDPVDAISALGHASNVVATPSSVVRRKAATDVTSIEAPRRGALSEVESQSILVTHGIRFPSQHLILTSENARQAVLAVGGRAVMKVVSPEIAHKSDVGGVRLDVTAENAADAFAEVITSARANFPSANIQGVLVQEQLEGHPVIVGVRNDDMFGPTVVVGSGGIYAELFEDQALALAPISVEEADALLDRTKLGTILAGSRGRPPLARMALAELIVAMSRFAWSARNQVASVELNPVLVQGDGVVAVDALIEIRRDLDGVPIPTPSPS